MIKHMQRTEADARIVIDRLLREAGWDIGDKTQVLTEEPTEKGDADYVLLDRRGRPLATIEAKRFSNQYGLEDGIRDGFLADYDIYLARTRITLEGVSWQGEDYALEDLERVVTAEDRNFLMVQEFREMEEKRGGDYPRKTIVFCVSTGGHG